MKVLSDFRFLGSECRMEARLGRLISCHEVYIESRHGSEVQFS